MKLRLCSAILVLLLFASACEAVGQTPDSPANIKPGASERVSATGFYFDTVVTIIAYDTQQAVLNDALAQCGVYERLLSKTIEDSDVSRINLAKGEPVTVDAHTLAILEAALEVSQSCGGAFDITIAPAMALWDFQGGSEAIPDNDALAAAIALVDYKRLIIENDSVSLPAGMQIDLGGVAKGYIADMIALYLEQRGVRSCMLNFGGNVVLIGKKPDGTLWNVGIQDPGAMTGESIGIVRTDMRSAVTSGIYERGFDKGGVRYHHILDPKTGSPAQNSLASVTIFSDSSVLGDALSTACFVLGYEGAITLLNDFEGVHAVFVFRNRSVKATEGIVRSLELLVE